MSELWARYAKLTAQPVGSVDEGVLLAYVNAAMRAQGLMARVSGVYALKLDVQHAGAVEFFLTRSAVLSDAIRTRGSIGQPGTGTRREEVISFARVGTGRVGRGS